jgi:hypothetical protein
VEQVALNIATYEKVVPEALWEELASEGMIQA